MSVYDIYGPCDNSQSSSRYRSSALTRFNNMTLEECELLVMMRQCVVMTRHHMLNHHEHDAHEQYGAPIESS